MIIYSVGYGNRNLEEFIALLKKYNINIIIDVRSAPYSRGREDFNKENLEKFLKKNNIEYIFLGHLLGARPRNPTLYVNGQVDYNKILESEKFKKGIDLVLFWKEKWKEKNIALMCSEKAPERCHRAVLIAPQLVKRGIMIVHIDDKLMWHDELEKKLMKRYGERNIEILYKKAFSEIAYKKK